ncbi:FUN14 domain-containing protein [Deinococcus sp.]|uniref:FUN14 domain-containing protein n=1 Tax=Deinococcus sp. TaxID=47478 RepID=UPI0025C150D1|nr:FUN14 domain-containing protein [Deinococcus sp.]
MPASQDAALTPTQHDLVGSLQAMLPDLSLGAILGFATGVAVKFVGRIVLVGVGLLFIAIQLLSIEHIVSVDWLKLQSLTEPWFRQGGEAGISWFTRVLTSRLPFVGAFIAGLLLGLRR